MEAVEDCLLCTLSALSNDIRYNVHMDNGLNSKLLHWWPDLLDQKLLGKSDQMRKDLFLDDKFPRVIISH